MNPQHTLRPWLLTAMALLWFVICGQDSAISAPADKTSGERSVATAAPAAALPSFAALVFVADHERMRLVPVAQRESFAAAAAGAVAQNVYLFAAGNGLATVIRAWIDRAAIADALGLTHDQQVLLAQTVGYPKDAQ